MKLVSGSGDGTNPNGGFNPQKRNVSNDASLRDGVVPPSSRGKSPVDKAVVDTANTLKRIERKNDKPKAKGGDAVKAIEGIVNSFAGVVNRPLASFDKGISSLFKGAGSLANGGLFGSSTSSSRSDDKSKGFIDKLAEKAPQATLGVQNKDSSDATAVLGRGNARLSSEFGLFFTKPETSLLGKFFTNLLKPQLGKENAKAGVNGKDGGGGFSPWTLVIIGGLIAMGVLIWRNFDTMSKLFDNMKPLFKAIETVFVSLVSTIGEMIAEVDWDSVASVFTAFFGSMKNMFSGFMTVINPLFSQFAEYLKSIDWNAIGVTIGNVAKGIFDAMNTLWENWKPISAVLFNALAGVDWDAIVNILSNVVGAIRNIASGVLETLFSVFNNVVGFINMDLTFSEALGNIFKDLLSNVYKWLVLPLFKFFGIDLDKFFKDSFKKVSDMITKSFDTVVSWLRDKFDEILGFMGKLWSRISDFFSSGLLNMFGADGGGANKTQALQALWQGIQRAISGMFSNIGNSFKDTGSFIKDMVLEPITKFFSSIFGWLAQVGKYFEGGDGFIGKVGRIGNVLRDDADWKDFSSTQGELQRLTSEVMDAKKAGKSTAPLLAQIDKLTEARKVRNKADSEDGILDRQRTQISQVVNNPRSTNVTADLIFSR